MKKTTIQLETLTCPSCVQKIENTLSQTEGVKDVKVLFNASKVKVTYDETSTSKEEFKSRIEKLGYEVLSVK